MCDLLALNGLPILASHRLGLFGCSKDRVQNEREQKYPAAGGQDGDYQPASARHYRFKPLGRGRRLFSGDP
jgi:hypothetical protein